MFVFASAVTDPKCSTAAAQAGVARLREADPTIEQIVFASVGSIFRNYNLIIDQVEGPRRRRGPGPDPPGRRDPATRISSRRSGRRSPTPRWRSSAARGPWTCAASPGGRARSPGPRSPTATTSSAAARSRRFSWLTESLPPYARLGEVDSIDGFVMALSPWAMRNLRFDESLGQIHGYDFDICMQARTAGKKVVTADLQVVHHHSLRLIEDPETWIDAYMRVAEKWDGADPAQRRRDRDWEWRARRAEAEAVGGAADGRSSRRLLRRRALEAARGDRRTASAGGSTAPLRALSASLRRAARQRGAGSALPSARRTCSRENAGRPRPCSRESRSATAEGARAGSASQDLLLPARSRLELASSSRRVMPVALDQVRGPGSASSRSSTGLRSQGATSAATASAQARPGCQMHAEAEEGGHHGELAARARSATKSSTAVRIPLRGPALARRRPRERHAVGRRPGLLRGRGTSSWASGWRCSAGIRSGA